MKKGKLIALVAMIIMVACLGVFLWGQYTKEQEQNAIFAELDNQIRPLNVKKQRLNLELEKLTEDYEAKRSPKATAQIIFTEMDAQVYDLCYPIMKERAFTGILAISKTEFPGAEGCMTMEQFQELVTEGWVICIKWDGTSEVSSWWPSLKQQIQQLGLEIPEVMYFPQGTYKKNLDATIQELGFSIAVHHAEGDYPLIQTEYEEGVWHLGALGLLGGATKTRFDEAIELKGNIIYLVGFELAEEKYEERSFTVMLDYFKSYQDDKLLVVGSVRDAREHYYSRVEEVSAEEERVYLEQKAALESQLADIDAQLEELQSQ